MPLQACRSGRAKAAVQETLRAIAAYPMSRRGWGALQESLWLSVDYDSGGEMQTLLKEFERASA